MSNALDRNPGIVEGILIFFIVFAASNILLNFLMEFVQKFTMIQMQSLLAHINCEIMKKSVEIDISLFDMPKNYDELAKSRESAHSLHNIIFLTLSVFTNFISLTTYLVLCFAYNIYFSLIALVVLIPASYFRVVYEKVSYGFDKKQMNDIRKNQYRYGLLLSNGAAQEIRFHNICKMFVVDFIKITRELVISKIRFSSMRRLKILLLDLPSNLLSIAVKIFAIRQIFLRHSPIGEFVYVDGIFSGLVGEITNVSNNISTFIGYNAKIDDFKKYFQHKETEHEDNIDGQACEITHIKEIRFENVYFAYPNTDKDVLNNVTFYIKPHEKVMLVGINGSGKSTIVKLLTGFYKPRKGNIFINGININNLSINSIRKLQSLVFQDFNVFSFTIRENVCLGSLDKKEKESGSLLDDVRIRKSLEFSGFSNAAYNEKCDLDLYINKEFSEDGIALSGGERQKLVIARAFFRYSDLLVLDEPTASLDPVSEEKIFDMIKDKYRSKICIIITHRLANAHTMDKIIVVDNGCVTDVGNHKEL